MATVHGMEYLLTWNCKHIHNVATLRRIERLCERLGYTCPVICTPDDLMGTRTMKENVSLCEIHRVREEIARECGYDMGRIFARMRERTEQLKAEGLMIVSPAPREPDPAHALREEPPKQ